MPENYLIHFGNKNSGRYPRGSGERPHQHDGLGSKIKTAFAVERQAIEDIKSRRYMDKLDRTKNKYTKKSKVERDKVKNTADLLEKNVDKYSDFDDEEFFKSLPKNIQQREINRGKKVLKSYRNKEQLWNYTIDRIKKSYNTKHIKSMYKNAKYSSK